MNTYFDANLKNKYLWDIKTVIKCLFSKRHSKEVCTIQWESKENLYGVFFTENTNGFNYRFCDIKKTLKDCLQSLKFKEQKNHFGDINPIEKIENIKF